MVFKESLFKGKAARSHDQFFFKKSSLIIKLSYCHKNFRKSHKLSRTFIEEFRRYYKGNKVVCPLFPIKNDP